MEKVAKEAQSTNYVSPSAAHFMLWINTLTFDFRGLKDHDGVCITKEQHTIVV
jgi:hypothetical protein